MGKHNEQLHKISLRLLLADSSAEFYYSEVNVRNFEHHWFYAGVVVEMRKAALISAFLSIYIYIYTSLDSIVTLYELNAIWASSCCTVYNSN